MAADKSRQERIGAAAMSFASIVVAGLEYAQRPASGDFVEPEPGWYVTFQLVLHGVILVLLLVALMRLRKMTPDRPGLRVPFTIMVLAGILGAAYVVGRDLGLV